MTTYRDDIADLLAAQRGGPPPARPDNLTLAGIVAQAILGVPGVQALSAGRFGTAATYGRGGRVPGVVFRRNAYGQLGIEVHLVASEAAVRAVVRESASDPPVDLARPPFLLCLAEQVRAVIQATGARHRLFLVTQLDVYIDNLG